MFLVIQTFPEATDGIVQLLEGNYHLPHSFLPFYTSRYCSASIFVLSEIRTIWCGVQNLNQALYGAKKVFSERFCCTSNFIIISYDAVMCNKMIQLGMCLSVLLVVKLLAYPFI